MNSAVIENIFKPMIDRWANLDKNKKIKYTVLASAALIIIVTSVMLFARTEYTVLYSNLDTNEAGEIYNKLTSEMNIKAKAQGNGTILVPKQQAEEVRMKLSAEGYPKSGLNYDLFKNSTGFGTTDFESENICNFSCRTDCKIL